MKYDYLIFDCYNLMYASTWNKAERLISKGDQIYHVEGIIEFLRRINTYIDTYLEPGGRIYWLMDNAKSSIQRYRKSLSENYKKTRVPQPDWFYKSLNNLELILKSYRNDSYLLRLKFLEADDYVPSIIKNVVHQDQKALLFSTDMDWCRSLGENVHIYKNGDLYTKEDFYQEYRFEATYSNICFYKIFYGDETDNILSTLPTLPKLIFHEIISSFSDFYQFLNQALDSKLYYLDQGWVDKIKKERENLILNYNLVTAPEISLQELDQYQQVCKFEEKKLRVIYDFLGMYGVDPRISMPKKSSDDYLEELLGGEEINRKRN